MTAEQVIRDRIGPLVQIERINEYFAAHPAPSEAEVEKVVNENVPVEAVIGAAVELLGSDASVQEALAGTVSERDKLQFFFDAVSSLLSDTARPVVSAFVAKSLAAAMPA
ncbi:hypothetical protein [Actinocorallia longicatena]|uniref:Uncharacterized protein n=1 Tax=Actinocorallia longicatena TaxID=111803 RepID=A0ABP6QNY0_9ACTN